MKHLFSAAAILIFIFFSSVVFSQEIKGFVRDSTGKLVPYASINLRNKAGDAIIAYTTTDNKGSYVLRIPDAHPLGDLYLEARCVGYTAQTKMLNNIQAKIDEINFILIPFYNELASVVVRGHHRPVLRTSGDTISFKATDFSSAQDRVIGDVIKRLPGISVAEDGTISYNNRPISGIYIGGDNLLDDKYSIAANTIPNGVVDQVQVIDNHQPIKVLQNKVTSNDVALNLTFTKAKLHLLGQETLSAGLPGNYYVDLNALLLKDQFKAINYLKTNNTGEDLQRDQFSHNDDGNQNRTGDEPPAALLSLGAVNNPNLARQRYLLNRSAALNINDLVNLKNGLQLRVNASYLYDNQQQYYSQQTSVFLPGDTIRYTETQANQFTPSNLHAQFALNVNKEQYYLNNMFVLNDNRSMNHSDLHANGTLLNQELNSHSTGFSNEFDLIKSVRSKNIIEAYSYISHLYKPEMLSIGPGYNDSIFNHGIPYAQLIQDVNVPTWFTNNYVSFKLPGRTGTTSFKTGFSRQSQSLTSALSVLQTGNSINFASDTAVNHSAWTKKKWYAEAAYDIPLGKLSGNLALPFTLQQFNYSDTGYALNTNLNRFYVNPQFWLKYKTGVENFLTLRYSYHNRSGGIEDIYQAGILKDYRTLYAGNAALTLQQNHLVSAGFNYRKSLTLFFANINASYSHTSANNITSSFITGNLQQRVVLPYPNSSSSWSATGSIGKYSFGWRTSFSALAQWQLTRSVQIQNGVAIPFQTTAKTFTLGADTKLGKQVNFSYHITGILTSGHSSAVASAVHFAQAQQQGSIDYNPFPGFQFRLSGEHYFTQRQGNANLKYFFADFSAKYHIKKWGADLQLNATNLSDLKTYDALYLSANTLTASSYRLPGRIILLKLLFNL